MKDHIHSHSGSATASQKLSRTIPSNQVSRGFAKVVAGGRIVRLRKEAPFFERLVTGESAPTETVVKSRAILESVSSNLEAGIKMVDKQETCLAKIGGRLSDMALSLNKARDPNLSHDSKKDAQKNFESARDSIRKTALETYDNTALFSNGPAKPVTIAVPSGSQWEGLSVDRANLAQPGLIIMDKGKVYGDGEGYTIDPGSVKRAFDEWRKMCVSNRMQSSLLTHRLHGVKQKLRDLLQGDHWDAPTEPTNSNGPLRRPHLQN